MSQQPETLFKQKVKGLLKETFGEKIWICKVQQVAKKGDPDLLFCLRGKFIAWELKVGKNKATKLQQHELNSIIKAEGWVGVITPENLNDAMEDLKCLAR